MADGPSGGGNYNKVGAMVLGAGLIAIIAIFGPPLLDDDDPEPEAATAPGTTVEAVGSVGQPQPTSRAEILPPANDLRVNSDDVVLTIVSYGMPARVSARATNPSITVRERFREVCIPETQFPWPCIVDYVVRRGTEVIVTAGDSLAGYWPSFEYLTGGSCKLAGGTGRDQICTLTMTSDVELEAMYYGSDSTVGDFRYPGCPPRVTNPPSWLALCTK